MRGAIEDLLGIPTRAYSRSSPSEEARWPRRRPRNVCARRSASSRSRCARRPAGTRSDLGSGPGLPRPSAAAPWDDPDGGAGVREPRRPAADHPAGALALDEPRPTYLDLVRLTRRAQCASRTVDSSWVPRSIGQASGLARPATTARPARPARSTHRCAAGRRGTTSGTAAGSAARRRCARRCPPRTAPPWPGRTTRPARSPGRSSRAPRAGGRSGRAGRPRSAGSRSPRSTSRIAACAAVSSGSIAAAGGDPPAGVRHPGVAVLEQQRAVVVDQDHPHGLPRRSADGRPGSRQGRSCARSLRRHCPTLRAGLGPLITRGRRRRRPVTWPPAPRTPTDPRIGGVRVPETPGPVLSHRARPPGRLPRGPAADARAHRRAHRHRRRPRLHRAPQAGALPADAGPAGRPGGAAVLRPAGLRPPARRRSRTRPSTSAAATSPARPAASRW